METQHSRAFKPAKQQLDHALTRGVPRALQSETNLTAITSVITGPIPMIERELISQAYSAFNQRDIDAALVLMSEHVSWPKASEGGRVVGRQEIRDYWTRQWAEFDPRVGILEVVDGDH